ncbi:DUF192 domain-containing protein [Candidatus Woesebacteria bacterium]|nr:DUF192 domain-containing protein [Candidatus Woesebacteria bacterium]
MKFFAIILVSTFYLLVSIKPVQALYDPRTVPNNKAGVHILHPDEISDAAKLVNSNGGDWGYVTIPIQPTDRDKDTWQTFMHKAKELKVIPIIRITTIPQGGTWARGHDTDLVDFANFLHELDWPIENRYIILFNEVNRAAEWGGTVDPEKYASIVKNAQSIFKERSLDFFLLGPSLDSALPNSSTSLSSTAYMNRMTASDPLIWSYFDGWSSHSYPNPGFVASPKKTGLQSIVGYRSEISALKIVAKPVFITETGWDQSKLNPDLISANWKSAWDIWQKDYNVVSVTPFVLQGGEQFKSFSLIQDGGVYTPSGQAIFDLPKVVGTPKQVEIKPKMFKESAVTNPKWVMPFFKSSQSLYKLENIFRVILGLPTKTSLTLKDIPLVVETAQNPKQWEKGLSERKEMGGVDGMLFVFPHYHIPVFWMKDMHFPIDMIWLASGKVVDITLNVQTETGDKLPTYSPKVPVNMVLETPAGWAEEKGIALGDELIIN